MQIVSLSVYAYFLASLLGRQWMNPNSEAAIHHYDYYFPFFSSLEFVFYVGWLKVAETLVNPFGEDDDDFDTNFLVDRNIQLCFLLIDQVGRYPPEPEKDKFWESSVPAELPYTVASLPFRSETPGFNHQSKSNETPVYLPKRSSRNATSDGLRSYPSVFSMMSGFKGSLFRQNSITESTISLDDSDKMRKISVRSTDGSLISRHGSIIDNTGLVVPKLVIPGTIEEQTEPESPLKRGNERHTLKPSFPLPPAVQRLRGGKRKVDSSHGTMYKFAINN